MILPGIGYATARGIESYTLQQARTSGIPEARGSWTRRFKVLVAAVVFAAVVSAFITAAGGQPGAHIVLKWQAGHKLRALDQKWHGPRAQGLSVARPGRFSTIFHFAAKFMDAEDDGHVPAYLARRVTC